MYRVAFATFVALCFVARSALAACPTPEQVSALAADWLALKPARGLEGGMSAEDGQCGQQRFVAELVKSQGQVVGYKAGLTNKAVQQRFNYPQPVRGVLLERMLLRDGAEVAAKFGSRPVFEADLVVEVKDEGINRARTPQEVLRHLSRIYPFIELPDLVVAEGEPLTGPVLLAINAGARLGVLGKPIAADADPALSEALATMTVIMSDQNGNPLGKGQGSALLGHPLNAVIWLADDLAKSGIRLHAGDLLSLGSFTPLLPPQGGTTIKARYQGLPGDPEVSVHFK